MGSIRRRVAGKQERRRTTSWRAKYTAPDGRQRSKDFARKVDAERWLSLQESASIRGDWIDPELGRESLAAYWTRWYARADELGSPQRTTLSKYETVWRLYLSEPLGRHPLASIRRRDVQDLVDGATQTASPWQGGEALKLIRMLLGRAVDDGILGRNPATGVAAPRVERTRPRILTPGEIEQVVVNLPERFRAMVLLDAYASLRWSELVALKRDDLDLDARTVRIDEKLVEVRGEWVWGAPKTAGSARTVDLLEMLVKPLAAHLLRFPSLPEHADSRFQGLVFTGERGGAVRRHSFRKAWVRACYAAGLEGVRVEWLRHSGASLAYLATRDIKAVAARLGHTSTRMMDTVYVEVYPEASRAVADAIDDVVRRSVSPESAEG